jgi:hypothetical protein
MKRFAIVSLIAVGFTAGCHRSAYYQDFAYDSLTANGDRLFYWHERHPTNAIGMCAIVEEVRGKSLYVVDLPTDNGRKPTTQTVFQGPKAWDDAYALAEQHCPTK